MTLVWTDDDERRWQRFITDFRARTLGEPCPLCEATGYIRVYVEGVQTCIWCKGAGRGHQVAEAA
jgi:hypothetical protein